MALHNDIIYNTLKSITENVHYMSNRYDNSEITNQLPYIVYQIIAKRPITADNRALLYNVEYQVTIVTRTRNEALIHLFEESMNQKEIIPVLVSTYQNDDYSINRVYQINILSTGGY